MNRFSKFLNNTFTKVAAVIAFLCALITVFSMVDNRYARADDVRKTQEQLIDSIRGVNINIEIVRLKSRRGDLKAERRELMLKCMKDKDNHNLKIMLEEINDELESINNRIDELESKKLTQ